MSKVVLKINGKNYEGVKTAEVSRSVEAVAGGFSVGFTDRWSGTSEAWGINAQDDVEIQLDGKSIIKGFVDACESSIAKDSREISVRGRDASGDLVDCSAETEPGQYKAVTFAGLAAKLTGKMASIPFSMDPLAGLDPSPFKSVTVQPGETVFECLERYARTRGYLMIPDGRGGVLVTGTGIRRCVSSIAEGENLLTGSVSVDFSQRYSEYVVKGQEKGADPGWNADRNSAIAGKAKDSGVKRKRPLTVIQETDQDNAGAGVRAQWEATVRAARSTTVTVTVQGFTQVDGSLWPINSLVFVNAQKRLGVSGTFLIAETRFSHGDSGSFTTLTLKSPDAYKPSTTIRKKKSDEKSVGWKF